MTTVARGKSLCFRLLATSLGIVVADAAHAQQAEVSEVVVTGSFIRGTPEDASLPVDVIGAEELSKRGNPSTLDIIKTLPVSSGVVGDTNQFDSRSSSSVGAGSINLRGLGPERTLVLLNGRRLAASPAVTNGGGAVDTNLIPSAAIGRIEILKDGAAATYGSDAIGGVVNFITRTRLDGADVAADYRYIDGSNGDYTASAAWGHTFGDLEVLLTGGYQHRSELLALDRDFANPTYLENPNGGYTAIGNPGTYIPLGANFAAIGTPRRDVNCASLSGFPGFNGATPVCYSRSTQFDNLVEKEDRYQLFGSVNYRVTDRIEAKLEALYAKTVVPRARTGPSQAITQNPTVEASAAPSLAGRLFVPASNPGFASYVSANPGVFPAGTVGVQLVAYRPLFLGGNPLFGGIGSSNSRTEHEAFRVSGGLKGSFSNDIGFDLALTYMEDKSDAGGYDTLVNRLGLALRGLGGPSCDSAPGTPGIQGNPGVGGCLYFNPFSTALRGNPAVQTVNPQFDSAATNSNDVIRWFYAQTRRTRTASLLVADAVLDGQTGLHLWGDDIKWALGAQFRKSTYEDKPNDINNLLLNPCLATPDFGVTNCASQTGPFGLLTPILPSDLDGNVYALFGELDVPITDDLQVQLAARYEDYGGSIGSTFDPKLALRWQVADWFALRGSVGSTFRGPPITATSSNGSTGAQNIRGVFRAVSVFGSPDLKPETALTIGAGALFKAGGFKASVDYWSFDFDNPITAEPVSDFANTLYPTNTTNRCLDPAYSAIRARFIFNDTNGNGTDDDCATANISRLNTLIINGSPIKTDGVDFSASYEWDSVFEGSLTVGVDGTYVNKYEVSDQFIEGIQVGSAFDAVGKLNYQLTAYPLPQWRGSAYAEFQRGIHNVRWTINYVDSYVDQRTDVFTPSVNYSTNGVPAALPQGKNIDSTVINNVAYRGELPWDATVTIAVDNVFDVDPPFVRLNYSYDPFVASPLGRTIKVGVRMRFH